MEACILIGGFLALAAAGYFVVGRLGRFLDSAFSAWNEEDAKASVQEEKEPGATDARERQGCCSTSDSEL